NIITRALGHRERVDVDIFELTLLPDDRLLFSTDGLHDHLEDDEMTTILLTMSPEDAAKEMVDRAIRAGSTDNVTALCVWAAPVSVLDAPPAAAPAEARMNLLLTALVLLGLVIFIAIVGYIVLAT
ncbi:MAG TPA: serine/threonine-protein phosphatase, partial [Chloroflexi bacterium]|nr:serine/threonine-protein phosphatase [Chloroflexota bacterium]